MADFHAADLWVAVVPETSQVGPAMEQAGKEAKGKFGQAVKGIGKNIHDEFAAAGDKAKDTFSGIGKIAKDSLGQSARDASSEMRNAFSSAFKDIPTALDSTKHAFAGIDDLAKTVGIDISGWKQPLENADPHIKNLDDKLKDALGSVGAMSSSFEGLPGKIGAAASKAGALAGEIGLVVEGLQMAAPYIERIDKAIHDSSGLGKWFEDLPKPEDMGNWLGEHLGAKQSRKFFGHLFGYDPGDDDNGPAATTSTPNKNSPWANSTWFNTPTDEWDPTWGPKPKNGGLGWFAPGWTWPKATPAPAPPSAQPPAPAPSAPVAPSSFTDGGGSGGGPSSIPKLPTPSVSGRADLRAAGGRVANLLEFAKSLEGTPYSQALRNDCSGMVAKLANAALGLEPTASFSTVNEGQWLFSHGFEPGLGGPGDLNIGWYDHGGGNAGHTAATLPGGIHAESGGSHGSFLLGPGAAGAENSEFSQHAHLRMDGSAGGSFRAAGLGGYSGGQIPTGAEHDPLYVTAASGGAGGSSGSPFESQGQQLGQGLLSGLMQSVGLDGSVFGGKSPMDWGAVKLGGRLLNFGMGMLNRSSGPMGSPGLGGGGGGGLGGLGGLIPSPGAMVSASAGPGGGSFGIKDAVGGPTSIHNDNRTIVSGNTIKDNADLVMRQQFEQNAVRPGSTPGRYGLSPVPVGP